MKNLLIISSLLAFVFHQTSFAQKSKKQFRGKKIAQFSFGGNYASPDLDAFNQVLDQFNQRISIGGDGGNFSTIDNMIGPSAALTFYGNAENKNLTRYLVELSYRGRFKSLEAAAGLFVPSQAVRLHMHTVHLGAGTLFLQSDNFDWGIGASIDGGILSTSAGTGEAKIENVSTDILFGASIFSPIYIGFGEDSRISLGIRPFYQLFFSEADFNDLNKEINPAAPPMDSPDSFKGKANNFGVSVHLAIIFRKIKLR